MRYVAAISPSGPTCTHVLRSFGSPSIRSAIEPATRSMPSSRAIAARPGDRLAVERLGACAQVLSAAEHAPLLRQQHELRSAGRRIANEAIRRLEVASRVGRGSELNGRCAQR